MIPRSQVTDTNISALHTDLGLQPERTALAWERTGWALLVCGAMVMKLSWFLGYGALAIAPLAALGACWIFASAQRRYLQQARGMHDETVVPNVRGVLCFTAMVCLLGTLALLLVILTPCV